MFGLSPKALALIRKAASQFAEIESVIVFGSRAAGKSKPGSDVDLALRGSKIDSATVSRFYQLLQEELPLPFDFDVVHYDRMKNPALKQHIDGTGKILYSRKSS